MFAQEKKTKLSSEVSKDQNKIAQGTTIKGDIEARGGFRIDGTIEGTVRTPAKVVIGKDGVVDGRLECENADIEGKFNGILEVTGTLGLKSTAVIEGEVVAAKLAVEPGAIFNATCTMRGSGKSEKNERPEGSKGPKEEKSA